MRSEVGTIERLVLKHARDAFGSPDAIARQWRALNFAAAPDFDAACREYDVFAERLVDLGAEILWLPPDPETGLDSIYVRDASVVTPGGLMLSAMGKAGRVGEPSAQARAFTRRGVPMSGRIDPPGCLEGGDVVWLDDRSVLVGLGYRTNEQGVSQFRRLLEGEIDTCAAVPLPHWRGPDDVFHLMSILSPVDRDLAVAYSPLMPVPCRRLLLARGFRLVEVPDEEFASMGANVLAIGPRRVLMLEGNPTTRQRLERAGADVQTYSGREISAKGGGGPTCLTRPIARRPVGDG